MVIDAQNSNIIYAGGSCGGMAICKSTNAGSSWSLYELTSAWGAVYTLAIHPHNSNIVFAGGFYDNGTYDVGRILKSSNGGVSWEDISAGLSQDSYNYVYSLAIDPNSPDKMYAGCSNGFFKSTNGGQNWVNINAGFNNICAVVLDPKTPETLYTASRNSGVYFSRDGGQSWSAMNDGMNTLQMGCLTLDSQNGILFAGSNGAGVFRTEVSTAIEIEKPLTLIPSCFNLKPNYPNPFNPITTIVYEIPATAPVATSVRVYNISGQMIKTLVNKLQGVGRYSVRWDGTNETGLPMPSGLYLCVFRAGFYTQSRKMVLLR